MTIRGEVSKVNDAVRYEVDSQTGLAAGDRQTFRDDQGGGRLAPFLGQRHEDVGAQSVEKCYE